jgi:RNA polymerase sigma factor (TIGR02999 family)
MGQPEITLLLQRWREGDKQAESELMQATYDELARLVRHYRRKESEGVTKQTTELVNELYIRLAEDASPPDWQSRKHFYGIAARQLRRVLVDEARKRRSKKRGGDQLSFAFDMTLLAGPQRSADITDLDDALAELEAWDPEAVHLVELRFFAGMKQTEIAEMMGVTEVTIRRRFNMAKVWLRHRLRTGEAVTLGATETGSAPTKPG